MRAILLAAAAVLPFAAPVYAATTQTFTVARVIDGDGLQTTSGKTMRLSAIDAPELRMPFGPEAKAALEQLALGQLITCVLVDIDRWGREVHRCKVGGQDIGAAMVAAGMAWPYREYGGQRYAMEEREAMCAGRGIWSQGVIAPWAWRKCDR